MRKLALSITLATLLALPMVAQTGNSEKSDKAAASGPPKILQIFREDVKPGKGAEHEKLESAFPVAFRKANLKYYSVALNSITGPSEAWFIAPLDSYTEFDDVMKQFDSGQLKNDMERLTAADGEVLTGADGWIATYAKDLSYHPDFKLGETRYIATYVYRVKPGYIDEFKELYKTSIAAHEKAGIDEHMLMYEVTYGAPLGTYIVFKPMKQVAELDAVEHSHGDAYKQALGPDWPKKRDEFGKVGLIGLDSNLYSINPRMSYVSPDVVAAAPDFWMPKETVQSASTSTIHTKKKIGKVTPAGKKTETTK